MPIFMGETALLIYSGSTHYHLSRQTRPAQTCNLIVHTNDLIGSTEERELLEINGWGLNSDIGIMPYIILGLYPGIV